MLERLFSLWKDTSTHKKVWGLALPMILSNLSVPLVALVDTMVAGRLPHVSSMAAVAIGSSFYTVTIGCLGFLRMGTTGFTSQAVGQKDGNKLRQILLQTIILALCLALIIGLLALPFSKLVFYWIIPSIDLKQTTLDFISWRLLGLPAALLNYALVGWFLGTQNARLPFAMLITTNLINILLSLLFVLVLKKGVIGIAQAAIIAEWCGVLVGCICISPLLRKYSGTWRFNSLTTWHAWKPLLSVNKDIFIRSLTLQCVFFLITLHGGQLGENIVAANVIILNGLLIISYLLDGFAHAIEALCGKAIGAKNKQDLVTVLTIATGWALIISLIFASCFSIFGHLFINLQTTLNPVRAQAYPLIPYLALLPLIAVWGYLLDGLFISATKAKEMRNSMLLSFIISLPMGLLLEPLGNDGLWVSFLLFMALRGVFLGIIAWNIAQKRQWVC